MRNFAGLLKPVVCIIKQVGRRVLYLLNNKRLIKNKYQTRNFSLQTVNYKWSWENIQFVKDFAAVLLALYKRGRAILFYFRFADTALAEISLLSFSSTKRIAISLSPSSAILFCVISWRTRGSERGSSTRNTFALCDWLLSDPLWHLWC